MLYTIGHSNHPIAFFIDLLQQHGITALGDVRSYPYSRYVPQYSRDALKAEIAKAGIRYVFLGKELGARSKNPACYQQGKVQFERLAQEPQFAEGLGRVQQGMEQYRIALMCAEKDPLDCHRAVLVARRLFETGVSVNHIKGDGTVESHPQLESRLLTVCNLPEGDMFKTCEEFIAEAYAIQSAHIAYQDDDISKAEATKSGLSLRIQKPFGVSLSNPVFNR